MTSASSNSSHTDSHIVVPAEIGSNTELVNDLSRLVHEVNHNDSLGVEPTPLPLAIVTGATGGMGEEIVAELARDHHVVALGRNKDKLVELVRAHPHNVTAVMADLAAELDTPAFLAAAGQAFDEVAVLVHAAAIAQRFSVESAEVSNWREHMDINVHVPAELTRVLLPALRKAGGTVVYVNSGAGRNGYGDNVVYAATKHALYALADSLRKAEKDIRVSTVAPGPTDTPMLAGLQNYDPAHVIAPVEVARAIRVVVDAGPTTQLTDIQVRPRIELDRR